MSDTNDNLVLISGESGTGKSASLMNIANPEGVIYLNSESGKKLPFPDKFKKLTVTDPMQIFTAFDQVEEGPNGEAPLVPGIHTIVIDTLTYLMDMYESFRKKDFKSANKAHTKLNKEKYYLEHHTFTKKEQQVILKCYSACRLLFTLSSKLQIVLSLEN